jgi:serine protease Do
MKALFFPALLALAFAGGYFIREREGGFPFVKARPNGRLAITPLPAQAVRVALGPDQDVALQRRNALVQAISRASPSVVFIGVTQIRIVNSPLFDDPFFRQFFPPSVSEFRSMGSGVILTDQGHIVTNYHVIENATKIEVHLPDGRKFDGQLLGADPYTDIAVVQINASGLPAIPVCRDDSLYIGEWAAAIGNPFGAIMRDNRPTVTVGVISACGREFTRESGIKYSNMIQTDAAINPGNSGGALVNCLGELIGINTFIISPSGAGSIGMGFAIPVGRVMKTLKEIVKYGKVRGLNTGVSIQNLNPYIASSLGLPNAAGVIINNVAKKSPGDIAGLKVGDVIIRVNRQEVGDIDAVSDIFSQFLPGDTMRVTILRDRKEKEFSLVLESKN